MSPPLKYATDYVNAHCSILSQCVAGADSEAGVYFVPTVNCCVFFCYNCPQQSVVPRSPHTLRGSTHLWTHAYDSMDTCVHALGPAPNGAGQYHADVSPVHRIYDRNLYPNATQGVSILGAK